MQQQTATIIAASIAASAALLVGYQHRRLLKHLALYQQDKSLGPDVPPTKLTVWLKRKKFLIGYFVLGVCSISTGMSQPNPPTKMSVFSIAMGFASIAYGLASDGLRELITSLINAAQRAYEKIEAARSNSERNSSS